VRERKKEKEFKLKELEDKCSNASVIDINITSL
jgi:hypothetical protein